MVVKYVIDLDDLIALQEDNIKKSKLHNFWKIVLGLSGFLTTFIIAFYFIDRGIVYSLFLSTPLYFVGHTLYTSTTKHKEISKLKKDSSRLIGERKLIVSNDGLYVERENNVKKAKWTEIIRVRSDDKRYFLYISDLQAIIIKKSPSNMSENETYEFNSLINKSLTKIGFDRNEKV